MTSASRSRSASSVRCTAMSTTFSCGAPESGIGPVPDREQRLDERHRQLVGGGEEEQSRGLLAVLLTGELQEPVPPGPLLRPRPPAEDRRAQGRVDVLPVHQDVGLAGGCFRAVGVHPRSLCLPEPGQDAFSSVASSSSSRSDRSWPSSPCRSPRPPRPPSPPDRPGPRRCRDRRHPCGAPSSVSRAGGRRAQLLGQHRLDLRAGDRPKACRSTSSRSARGQGRSPRTVPRARGRRRPPCRTPRRRTGCCWRTRRSPGRRERRAHRASASVRSRWRCGRGRRRPRRSVTRAAPGRRSTAPRVRRRPDPRPSRCPPAPSTSCAPPRGRSSRRARCAAPGPSPRRRGDRPDRRDLPALESLQSLQTPEAGHAPAEETRLDPGRARPLHAAPPKRPAGPRPRRTRARDTGRTPPRGCAPRPRSRPGQRRAGRPGRRAPSR